MEANSFGARFVEFIFSWVKAIADGMWSVFRGTGASGAFFRWIGDNWLILLAVLLVGGVVTDWAVWMLRWRPYWLWFGKKRRVYDEEDLEEPEEEPKKPAARKPLRRKKPADTLFEVAPEPETAPIDLFDPEPENAGTEQETIDLFDPEPEAAPVNADPLFDGIGEEEDDMKIYQRPKKESGTVEWFDGNTDKV